MLVVPINSMILRSHTATRLCHNNRSVQSAITAVSFAAASRSYYSSTSKQQSQLNQSNVQLYPGITFESLHQLQHMRMTPDDESRCALAYCLSFSNDESDFKRNFAKLDSIMKTQLEYNRNFFQSSPSVLDQRLGSDNVTAVSSTQRQQQQSTQPIDTDPLPRTLQDALRPCKSRSIVITEKYAPFRIVNVNSCWEQLCGYSYIESKGKTLGSLLRGPQTDPLTATTMIAKLLQGEDDVGATLINYKKDGQAFYNRIRAGPLFDEETGDISHFVGLLQEIGNVTTSSDSHNANGYESSLSNDESKKQNVYA